MKYLFALCFISQLFFSACSTFFGKESTGDLKGNADDLAEKKDKNELIANIHTLTPSDTLQSLELKQAKLWAKVDELEDKVNSQKARIKILEKGLMLGIMPKDVSNDYEELNVDNQPDEGLVDRTSTNTAIILESSKADGYKDNELSLKNDSDKDSEYDKQEYDKKMSDARELFRSGHYGRAYMAFLQIDKDFSNISNDHEQKYWLGRCWYHLKEYQSARQQLQQFVNDYSSSVWKPSAMLYLGKVELDLGLKEMAIKRFQEIIQKNPYEGTAEAAKQILANLHKGL
ncbi:MAG: tetratricopeptide repeat protein [Bdellovibrionota bacterium]